MNTMHACIMYVCIAIANFKMFIVLYSRLRYYCYKTDIHDCINLL